jgi:hypothetical protein
MTMTETSSRNGHGTVRDRARAFYDADPGLDGETLSRLLGGTPGARQCRGYLADFRTAAQIAAPESRRQPRPATPAGRQNGTQPPIPAPSRQRRNRRLPLPPDLIDRWGRPIVGSAITALALLLSYSHMRHLAELAGVSWPHLAPLLVDGLLATALLCLRRHPRYWPAWLALILSVAAALVLNGLAERPELVELEDVRLWWALMVPATAAFGVHLVTKR